MKHDILTLSPSLTLAVLDLTHADTLFQLVEKNRVHLSEWLSWAPKNKTREHSREFIRMMHTDFIKGAKYPYGIFFNDQLIGMIALNKISRGGVNLTYWLDEAQQGKGIVIIGTKFLTKYALTELGFNRVMIRCATGNTKSRAIPTRLNFIHEGTAREDYWLNEEYVDIEVYSLLPSDLTS